MGIGLGPGSAKSPGEGVGYRAKGRHPIPGTTKEEDMSSQLETDLIARQIDRLADVVGCRGGQDLEFLVDQVAELVDSLKRVCDERDKAVIDRNTWRDLARRIAAMEL